MGTAIDRERKEKMDLENYLRFLDSEKQMNLTMSQLNGIIVMHGYKRINKVPKKVLIDAIDAIDLMDPARSTLEKQTSLPEIAKLEDVIEDLNSLSWQECCVTSVQTLNSCKEDLADAANNSLQIVSHSASVKTASLKRKKEVTKPKPKRKKTLKSLHDIFPSDAVQGGTSASSSSRVADEQSSEIVNCPKPKPKPKPKRRVSKEGGVVHAPSCC